MSDDTWIIIPNWDKFQHYKDRDPVWIKLYTELNSRAEWLDLTDAERGLLVTVWVEYARSDGRLRASKIPSSARQKGRKRGLDRLVQAGFLRLRASTPARARARGTAKTPRDRDRDRDRTPKPPLNLKLVCPECGLELKSARRLNEHREVVHATT